MAAGDFSFPLPQDDWEFSTTLEGPWVNVCRNLREKSSGGNSGSSWSLGRFQILQLAFLMMCDFLAVIHIPLENFTAAVPEHRCWVRILDNGTLSDNGTGLLSQEDLLRISIPLDSNLRPEKCRRFVHPQWQLLQLNSTFWNLSEAETEPCMDGWVYDSSSFVSTIVTKWDLVCEFQLLTSISKFILTLGILLGNTLCGHLTDRFGRRLIMIICVLNLAIADTCAAFAPTFLLYSVLRFLADVSITVILTNSMVLGVEWTGRKFQAMTVLLLLCSTGLGQALLGGLAYFVRNWQILQLELSIPVFFLLPFSRFVIYLLTYGLMLNLQNLGSNTFLLMILFGAQSITANCITLIALNHLGRRISQFLFMSFMGTFILATALVPQGNLEINIHR
ncbi:steroid transmembrane transporter SLC22A24-like [Dipodomys merriami]|uniref:steroid transmembrane transporter SLC22A24-like n=1 Tax=Dipodomys merriami TaxID=94247 RepID=UPI00384BB9CB